MKNQFLVVAAVAAFALAGCTESVSVEDQTSGKLTLFKPAAVSVERGGMTKAEIKISRKDLAGEVTIRFTNLPDGIDIVETDSKIVGNVGSYTLRATDTADLVENSSADVTASGGPGNVSVSATIDITVTEKL